jgi:MoaA/NifB/PqqE/SkfB family radical SAM enzyme
LTLSEHRLICTRPFEWCEVHPNGLVFLCCPAWLKRPIGNILDQNIAQIWNSPVAREIRKSIFNHSFHNCNRKRCPFLTNTSAPVGVCESIQDRKVRHAIENNCNQLTYLPRKVNLCFDHSCNLACPSCRPDKQQATGAVLDVCRQVSEKVAEQLLPQVKEVTLSGFGDPFGSPTYLALLRLLNQQPNPPALRLHSNGQLWTERTWNSLQNLHQSVHEAEVSIDAATAETYSINRPGGSFDKLLINLAYLAQQPFPLTFSMVVQQNNYREMPEFISLAKQFNARVYFSRLVNWGTFDRNDYLQRAIYLPQHPQYAEFRTIFNNIAANSLVNPGNLHDSSCLT